MRWYDKFSRKFRNFGIPNLMGYITSSMIILYLAQFLFKMPVYQYLSFSAPLILQGQVWRLITFLLLPPYTTIVSVFFYLLLYYSIGRQLEYSWGTSTFNFYYLLGVIGTIIAGFITGSATNHYLNLSLFMAYAVLFPETEFRFMFLFPIKAKYLGYAEAILYVVWLFRYIFTQNWGKVAELLASVINFFIFFGPDIYDSIKRYFRTRKRQKEFRDGTRGNWK